mgnify:CR=1 FL=1
MREKQTLIDYWQSVAAQDEKALERLFHPDARIRWHNTNECFTVGEFIRANCEYPGIWHCDVERIEVSDKLFFSITRVWSPAELHAFHAVSFFEISEGKITSLDEYWGEDGPAPIWRQAMQIGTPIKPR